jgi:hypothetical protein
MNLKFKEIIDQFPRLMEELTISPFITKSDLKDLPEHGIYVFYENGIPMYVGRSERLKSRLKEHSQQSSGHTSATFAFNIAKQDAKESGIDINKPRRDLERNPQFAQKYKDAKDRVSKMQIKAIEIDDPVEQTLFEVYAALELGTNNEWRTH